MREKFGGEKVTAYIKEASQIDIALLHENWNE